MYVVLENQLAIFVRILILFFDMQEIKLGKITRILVHLNMISNKYRLQIILIMFCIKNIVISKGNQDEYYLIC
jgi:hypothetical protein